MKFVNYYSEADNSSVTGNLFLKGNFQFEKNALQLLTESNYDVQAALRKIIFPVADLLGEGDSNMHKSKVLGKPLLTKKILTFT